MADPDFWGDQQKAQTIINEANALKDYVNTYNKLSESHEELQMTHDLLKEDPDQDLQNELVSELKSLTKQFNEFELQLLLSEPYDKTMRSLSFTREPAAPNHRIGVQCFSECTPGGQNAADLRWKPLITSQGMKQESSLSLS